jgi:hypothetical protein
VAVPLVVAVVLGGCGPAGGGSAQPRPTGSVSASALASASAKARPALAAGAVPASCAVFDDAATVAGLDAGSLDDDPTYVDPASHPMPTGPDELDAQQQADSLPGLSCTWSRPDAFVLLLVTVHPDSSPWYHQWTMSTCGAALTSAGTATLSNGESALYCTGQYLEQLSFTARGRVYEVARSQEPHSYRDQLVAYANFLTGV